MKFNAGGPAAWSCQITAQSYRPVAQYACQVEHSSKQGCVVQVPTPEGMAALDLDTIRLTAQFVARNGKAFLTGLAAKEHGNPHFNFLKPTNSFFGFFTALCDAYFKVLMPPKDLPGKLRRTAENRWASLCLRDINKCLHSSVCSISHTYFFPSALHEPWRAT